MLHAGGIRQLAGYEEMQLSCAHVVNEFLRIISLAFPERDHP